MNFTKHWRTTVPSIILVALLLTFFSLAIHREHTNICSDGEIAGSQILDEYGGPMSFVMHVQFSECVGQPDELGMPEGKTKVSIAYLLIDFAIFIVVATLLLRFWKLRKFI